MKLNGIIEFDDESYDDIIKKILNLILYIK